MDATAQVGVVAIRQAGTAAAFAPLVRHLRARAPSLQLHVFCYPPARATWERLGFGAAPVNTFDDAAESLARLPRVDFVLTGTSLDVADDAKWWAWATDRRVRSIAFVDQWVNYWQRFASQSDGTPRFDFLPDRIAVVDDVAARQLVSLGCDPVRVVIAGSPAFDALFETDRSRIDDLRTRWSERGQARVVLFTCEPATPPLTGVDVKRRFGFCEAEVIDIVAAAAADTAARLSRKIHIVFKRHPIQIAHGMHLSVEPHDPRFIAFSEFDGDRLEAVNAADLVVGMRSMLLFEASLIGRPVVSVQPNRLEACDLTDGRPGIRVVGNEAELRRVMYAALLEPSAPTEMPGTLRHAAHEHARRFAERLELV